MPRLLPDAEMLVLTLMRPALPDVAMGTIIPDDVLSRLPYVVITRSGGAARDIRFLDRPVISVDAWHTSKTAASALAEALRVALLSAWEQQTTTEHGHVAWIQEQSGPAEVRTNEQPDTVFRYQASYALATRPPVNTGAHTEG